jgi:hypothetical protein
MKKNKTLRHQNSWDLQISRFLNHTLQNLDLGVTLQFLWSYLEFYFSMYATKYLEIFSLRKSQNFLSINYYVPTLNHDIDEDNKCCWLIAAVEEIQQWMAQLILANYNSTHERARKSYHWSSSPNYSKKIKNKITILLINILLFPYSPSSPILFYTTIVGKYFNILSLKGRAIQSFCFLYPVFLRILTYTPTDIFYSVFYQPVPYFFWYH